MMITSDRKELSSVRAGGMARYIKRLRITKSQKRVGTLKHKEPGYPSGGDKEQEKAWLFDFQSVTLRKTELRSDFMCLRNM